MAIILDDFNDGDVAEWTIRSGALSAVSSPTYEGSHAAELSQSFNGGGIDAFRQDVSVGPGERVRVWYQWGGASPSEFAFGLQSGTGLDDVYGYSVDARGDDSIRIRLYNGGTDSSTLASDTVSFSSGVWVQMVVDWKTNGDIIFTLNDSSGSQIKQIPANDTTHTSAGGIGFGKYNGTDYFDYATKESLTPTATATTTPVPTLETSTKGHAPATASAAPSPTTSTSAGGHAPASAVETPSPTTAASAGGQASATATATPRPTGTAVVVPTGPIRVTTALPDATTDAITPIDASVEDQLTVPAPEVTDYGDVRVQARVTDSGDAFGTAGEVVVAHDGGNLTLTGLLDGEKYDLRVRTETEHVTGSWAGVSAVTLLPAPASVQVASIGTTSATVEWEDTADNEDDILVERRRMYAGGWGAWEAVATKAAGATQHVDDEIVPSTSYQWRVSNRTKHVVSRATTAETTSDTLRPTNEAPPSGWYVEVDTPTGTRTPSVVGTPTRNPSVNDLERVTVPVAKDDAWDMDVFDDADVRVWRDGERLPVDTLVERRQTEGRTELVCEGTTALHEPDTYEFLNTDVHAAFQEVMNDTPYTADIEPPEADNREFDTVDTEGAFADYFQDPGVQDPVIVDGSGISLAQTCFFAEAEDLESGSTTASDFSGGDPDWSNNEAVAIPGDGTDVSQTFTLDHEIPDGSVGLALRIQYENFDGTWVAELDGTTVGELDLSGTTTSSSWIDVNGYGSGFDWNSSLSAGEHTLSFYLTSSGGGQVYVDCVAPHDQRYHSLSNFDESGDYFTRPTLYPTGGIDVILLHEGFLSATGARVEASFNTLSGDQAIALSNDYGANYATAQNTGTLETDFSSPGPDIQMRVTLDAYGSRSGTSPTQGFETQRLQSYTLYEDVRDSLPLSNSQFSGDRKDVLTSLVERGDMLWAVEWDRDAGEPVIRMANVGDLSSNRDMDIVDYDWSTQTLGRQVERATVKGGKQPVRDEFITADHGVAADLDHQNLVPGQEVVRDPDTGTVYQRGTDYEMSTYVTGQIRTSATGNISDGQTLAVDYAWKPEGDFAIGGYDNKKRLIKTFTGATTDAICQSIAYYLTDELSEPIESGTITVSELPPGWSVLEALAADGLPNRERWVPRGISVQDGRVELDVASRQRVQDVVADLRGRLEDHGERI